MTHTYWSDRWKPLEERIGSSSTAARSYLWGERPGHRDELILRDRDTDGNGSLDERLYATMDYFNGTAVLNTSGVVQERYAYSAFGVRRIMAPDFAPRSSSSFAWDFGFQGQFRDTETGWYNYGYRFYVPMLGRWINRDPIGEDGGTNLYIFVENRATNLTDFFGRQNFTEYVSTCSVTFDCSCGNGDSCGSAPEEGFGTGISPADAEAKAKRELLARLEKQYGDDSDPCGANDGDCLCPSRAENPYGVQQECQVSGFTERFFVDLSGSGLERPGVFG